MTDFRNEESLEAVIDTDKDEIEQTVPGSNRELIVIPNEIERLKQDNATLRIHVCYLIVLVLHMAIINAPPTGSPNPGRQTEVEEEVSGHKTNDLQTFGHKANNGVDVRTEPALTETTPSNDERADESDPAVTSDEEDDKHFEDCPGFSSTTPKAPTPKAPSPKVPSPKAPSPKVPNNNQDKSIFSSGSQFAGVKSDSPKDSSQLFKSYAGSSAATPKPPKSPENSLQLSKSYSSAEPSKANEYKAADPLASEKAKPCRLKLSMPKPVDSATNKTKESEATDPLASGKAKACRIKLSMPKEPVDSVTNKDIPGLKSLVTRMAELSIHQEELVAVVNNSSGTTGAAQAPQAQMNPPAASPRRQDDVEMNDGVQIMSGSSASPSAWSSSVDIHMPDAGDDSFTISLNTPQCRYKFIIPQCQMDVFMWDILIPQCKMDVSMWDVYKYGPHWREYLGLGTAQTARLNLVSAENLTKAAQKAQIARTASRYPDISTFQWRGPAAPSPSCHSEPGSSAVSGSVHKTASTNAPVSDLDPARSADHKAPVRSLTAQPKLSRSLKGKGKAVADKDEIDLNSYNLDDDKEQEYKAEKYDGPPRSLKELSKSTAHKYRPRSPKRSYGELVDSDFSTSINRNTRQTDESERPSKRVATHAPEPAAQTAVKPAPEATAQPNPTSYSEPDPNYAAESRPRSPKRRHQELVDDEFSIDINGNTKQTATPATQGLKMPKLSSQALPRAREE
ncbi:MAG: hypothetical protein Q9195_008680 [Heterodermia aff. obscurata]